MATGNRTLKLSILADVDDLKKKLDSANKDVETSAGGLEKFGKMATAAFVAAAAAAAAYAVKIGVDGVKAAIEDEAAQVRLASALKTATGATSAQIAATEAYITKTSLAVGITDDELRPAFQRLSVSTGDVKKSQDLLNLALDVSKGTGKPLADVTEALAKAYDGNEKSLAKLGIGLSAADLKAMDFNQTTKALSDLYGGAASRNAETFQGRIDRLKVGFSEAKETIGYALLPVIEKLIGYIFTYGVPMFEKFKDAADNIKDAIGRNKEAFQTLGEIFKQVYPIIADIFGKILTVAGSVASAVVDVFGKIVGAIEPTINFIITGINKVITGLNYIKPGADIGYIPKIDITPTPKGSSITTPKIATPATKSVIAGIEANTSAAAAQAALDKQNAALDKMWAKPITAEQMALNAAAETARWQGQADAYFAANPTINITVNGAIDPVSTARQINNIIQNEATAAGAFPGLGSNRFAAMD